MLSHHELGLMKDHVGLEELKMVNASILLLSGYHFLKYWSEGEMSQHLRCYSLRNVELIDEKFIEVLSPFKQLISLKLSLKSAPKVNVEESVKLLENSLPLLDNTSLFETESSFLSTKPDPRKVTKKRNKLECVDPEDTAQLDNENSIEDPKYALVVQAAQDQQYHICEKLIHNCYFVFAMHSGPEEIPLNNLVQQYPGKIMFMQADPLQEETLKTVRKEIEKRVDHLDLIVVDNGLLFGTQPLLKDFNEEWFLQCSRKHIWATRTMILTFGDLLEKSKDKKLFVCLTHRLSSITENQTSRLFDVRITLAGLNMLVRSVSIEMIDINIISLELGMIYAGALKKLLPPGADGVELSGERFIRLLKMFDRSRMNGNFVSYDGSVVPF